ncbi:hypothetical protein AB1Y20_000549 [Prymnesium parvum]|uniref:Sperm-associated antigen 16 protein n=1 Tax=Prymnesium parvum TaxID=97485 RepID=A0AB34K9V2_PRYPA
MESEDAYYLEQVTLDDDDDDDEDFEYAEVDVPDDDEEVDENGEDDEDLEQALATIKAKEEQVGGSPPRPDETPRPAVSRRPEVIDDFIRHVLLKLGMTETLDMFQREWYRLSGEGKLSEADLSTVPDIYLRNQQLAEDLRHMRVELGRMQDVAHKAKSTWDKFRKERDFHKMHHKRVVQEKNKLIVDLKRLKTHYSNYEPMLQMMRTKYETAMKEKMLMKLERDRLASKVGSLEAQLRTSDDLDPSGMHQHMDTTKTGGPKKIRGAKLPMDSRDNPHLETTYAQPKVERWGLTKTNPAHSGPISSIALHPSKPIVATASDDSTWKMWSLNSAELIMSGDGHKGWLSGIDFAPSGRQLATSAEDGTVKIWDFEKSRCVQTLMEHTQAIWSLAYMTDSSEFLASASMDHTAKLWDLTTGRCRQTFRGHVDAINSICFQPFSNNICTGSGDKTVSLWDCRSGLCIQTFYGHKNAINSVNFSLQGDTIVSADADGTCRIWDVRRVAEICAVAAGRHPCNSAVFDPSGKAVAAACDDAVIRCFDAQQGTLLQSMSGHTDAVQCCVFAADSSMLVSGGSDMTFRTWS